MSLASAVNINPIKEALISNGIPLIPIKNLEDAKFQVDNIKQNSDGYTAIGVKNSDKHWTQWHIRNSELIKTLPKLMKFTDIYFSINSMLSPVRQLRNIRHLQAFWVDLDYYKIPRLKNKTSEEMIALMRKNGLFDAIEPSFFVDSGNGMYIFYLIDPATIKALPIWQKIQETLVQKFSNYGADPQSSDAVHVLRLAGTVNSKTHRKGRFIFNTKKTFRYQINSSEDIKRYTIPEMAAIFLPTLPLKNKERYDVSKSKSKDGTILKQKKAIALFNLHSLHYSRLLDIEKLQSLRGGDCLGCRETMTFLYRYYSCLFIKSPADALKSTLDFNKQFKEPLSKSEVIKATKSAEKAFDLWEKTFKSYLNLEKKPKMAKFFSERGCYIYSNIKLIDVLSITDGEMSSLKTIISQKEKNIRAKTYRNEWNKAKAKENRRNSQGLTKRQEAKLNNLLNVIHLHSNGMKQTEIAKLLDITQQGVSKLIKEFVENLIEPIIMSEYIKITSEHEKKLLSLKSKKPQKSA